MDKRSSPISDLLVDLVPDDFFLEDPLLGCVPFEDLPEDRTHEEHDRKIRLRALSVAEHDR